MTGSGVTWRGAGEEAGSPPSSREDANAGSRTVERLRAGSSNGVEALGSAVCAGGAGASIGMGGSACSDMAGGGCMALAEAGSVSSSSAVRSESATCEGCAPS